MLTGWENYYRLVIDGSKIEGDLTDFPVQIALSSGTGLNSFDATDLFTELEYTIPASGINDDFTGSDGEKPDQTLWQVTESRAGSTYINNNKARLSTIGGISGYTRCLSNNYAVGDFDVQVDWDKISHDTNSILYTNLVAYTADGGNRFYLYYYYDTKWTFHSQSYNGSWNNDDYTDATYTSTKLRIKRVGSTWSTYKWNGSSWDTLVASSAYLSSTDPVYFSFYVNSYASGYPAATIDFDNFQVTADSYLVGNPDINQRKIIITDANDNLLHTEIELFDSENKEAVLWTKIPTIASGTDTTLYLYYDSTVTGTDNNHYTGAIGDLNYQLVIDIGDEGTYDTLHAGRPVVIKESNTSYKMWYSGHDGTNWRIIYATSTNGITWSNHQLVLNIGAEGTYDTNGAGLCSVIKESASSYKMWYSGHDGSNWRVLYATSTNGTTWTNHQLVLDMGDEGTYDTNGAISPYVIKDGTTYKIWYGGYDSSNWRILYATSTNGTSWSNHQMVVDVNIEGTYDTTHAYYPCVVKESDTFYRMWYTGNDGTNQKVLYATSTSGISWSDNQLIVNSNMEGINDTSGATHAYVIKEADYFYKMWYSGHNGTNYKSLYSTYWNMGVWDKNFVSVYHMNQDPTHTQTVLYASEVSATGNPAQALQSFSAKDCTGLTKANGMLKVDLKVSNPAIMSVASFEITSAGTYDSEEWAHTLTTAEKANMSTSYQTFFFPLSTFVTTGGELDVTQIDYIRWWCTTTGASITLYWKNAEIIWEREVVKDSTSYNNNATAVGSMTLGDLSDSKIGEGLDFDGTDDFLYLGTDVSLNPTTAATYEAIFKTSATAHENTLFCKISQDIGVAHYHSLFQIGTNGSLGMTFWDSGGSNSAGANTNNGLGGSFYDGTYHYAAGKIDLNDDKKVRVYTDGVLNVVGTTTINSINDVPQDPASIAGRMSALSGNYKMTGILDEMRISDTARSSAWLNATYYSNWNQLINFYQSLTFIFTNPIPVDSSTSYGVTTQLQLITTISGPQPSYFYDASFYNFIEGIKIGSTVSGIQSGQYASVNMSTISGGVDYQWYVIATSSGFEDTSDVYTFTNRFLCEGYVEDGGYPASGIPVRLYRRGTGELIGYDTSSGVSGTFSIPTDYNEYHYVIGLYSTNDTNAVIADWLIPS